MQGMIDSSGHVTNAVTLDAPLAVILADPVKSADRLLCIAVVIVGATVAIGLFPAVFCEPTDCVDLCLTERTVTEVHLGQSKIRTTLHRLIRSLQQDDETVADWCAFLCPPGVWSAPSDTCIPTQIAERPAKEACRAQRSALSEQCARS
jgi:hypothetical protein